MFHSVTINGKNTWDDYHMVPANGIYLPPPPEQKRTTIDLKTGNGLLDVSTVLTGYPFFQNRSGELQYLILDPWDLAEQGVGGPLTLEKLEARVKKNFSGSNVNRFFTMLRERNIFTDTENDINKYMCIVILGENETQTAITVTTMENMKWYRYSEQNPRFTCYNDAEYGYNAIMFFLVTNGTYSYIHHDQDSIITRDSRYFNNYAFSFSNIPTVGGASYPGDNVCIVLPNMTNATYDSSLTRSYINQNVYVSSSSNTVLVDKSAYKNNAPETVSPMPNAYDVYSELLNDIHGTSGNMLFEDDPGWYYQGHFTVRSMDTNTIRRSAIIGYELSPYKLKSTQVTKTVSTVDSSTWSNVTINQDELLTMPVMPSVTISGTFSSETVTLRFTKQDGSYVEKNISQADTYTWPDVVLYKQVTVQFKGNSGKTATITFRPGRL